MQIIPGKEAEYEAYKAANSDPYGGAVVTYTERWADSMEQAIAEGAELEAVAKKLSHDTDIEGITGFMYGCAASALSQFWVHGERLRKWHNLDVQLGTEGEKANESGGVLNPALINIG